MPSKMTEPRQLFLHELGDILYAERVLAKALPKMAKEASDAELRTGFEDHLQETRGQIQNLEEAFRALGEKPTPERCPGIEGIKAEHDEFMRQKPSPEICDLFLTGAAARAEHYEIAAYTGLVTMAQAMGEKTVARLLKENLGQEKEALKKVETIGKRMMRSSATAAMAA
jgi:ferritin-like metal-binding protein YciE